ncbi:hypothetical protein TNCV_4167101 [Trichonephila clavipes]|nr:hypothetical protein TNCV_4167101 [Trichonephila clavipes]
MVESYKLSPILHVQDSPVPRSVLVRKWVQDFIENVMRRIVAPVECPAQPWMDFLVNEVEVSSRIPTPPLITRCDKSIQTNPPTFISNPLERRPLGTLFCWCPTIILSLHWMDSSFNLVSINNCSTMCLFSFIPR